MKTKSTTEAEITREWHLLDAKSQVLGRLATQIARLLTGKDKPNYVPHLDCGDHVVVTNASQVKVTGRKADQKMYYRHSGYPGGFKEISYQQQMAKDPREIIRHAVAGMLPKNKLRAPRLAKLRIFVDAKHPYEDKLNNVQKSKN